MTNGLTFLVETERAEHKSFSQVMNGIDDHVELDREIVKQTSPNANSLALVCDTVYNKEKLSRQTKNGLAFNVATGQSVFELSSVTSNDTAFREMA